MSLASTFFPVSGVEAHLATVEQSMEFTQSPLHGLLFRSSISCRASGGICCLPVRGISRGGFALTSVSLSHDVNLRIGPGLWLCPPGRGRSSRCVLVPPMVFITTRGPLAPSGICIGGGSQSLSYHEDDFPYSRVYRGMARWAECVEQTKQLFPLAGMACASPIRCCKILKHARVPQSQ